MLLFESFLALSQLLKVSLLVLQVPYVRLKLPNALLVLLNQAPILTQLLFFNSLSASLQGGKFFSLSPLLFELSLALGLPFGRLMVVVAATLRGILETLWIHLFVQSFIFRLHLSGLKVS